MRPAGPLALALAWAALATPAAAGDFWQRSADLPHEQPALDERQELIDKGDQYVVAAQEYLENGYNAQAAQDRLTAERFYATARRWASRAVSAYEAALELDPNDAELHYLVADLLYVHFFDHYDSNVPMRSKRDEIGRRIIAHWDAFERLSPHDTRRIDFTRDAGPRPLVPTLQFGPVPYQFSRSIILTKLGGDDNFERALADYDYLLSVTPRNDYSGWWIAQVLTNSAELLMALGRIDEAIARYREGLQYENRALYRYGLAVAYDRAGFGDTALQLMREAALIDRFGPQFGELLSPTVFFIPEGELFYYQALGLESLGDVEAAREKYELYLQVAKTSPYHARAKERLQGLSRAGAGDARRQRQRRR